MTADIAEREHLPAQDVHVSSSSASSSRLAPREGWAGAGWRPPTEQPGRPSSPQLSSSSWVGGGAIGGVPERNRPSTPEELSALGKDVWRKAGGYPPSAGAGVDLAGAAGSSSSSSFSPSWAASSSSLSPSLNSSLLASAAAHDPNAYDLTRSRAFVCRSLSECEPCPPQARGHPFCRPYGNRRLVACRAAFDEASGAVKLGTRSSKTKRGSAAGGLDDEDRLMTTEAAARTTRLYEGIDAQDGNRLALRAGGSTQQAQGSSSLPPAPGDVDLLGWEACGKVVRNETRDYLEFVMILVLLALFALLMLIRRNRYLVEKMHFEGGMSPSVDSAGAGTMEAGGSSSRLRGGAGVGDARRTRRVMASMAGGGKGGGRRTR